MSLRVQKLKPVVRNFLLCSAITLAFFVSYNLPTVYDFKMNLKTGTFRRLLTSYDITSTTFLPLEIIEHGRMNFGKTTLDAINVIEARMGELPHSLIEKNNMVYSSYPPLMGIMAVPFYYLPIVLHKIPTLGDKYNILKVLLLGRLVASFYTAVAVTSFYWILKTFSVAKTRPAILWQWVFLIFYGLGTNVHAIASRGLWQHTSSLLFISLAVLFMLKAMEQPKQVKWLGMLCGLAVVARPSNILFAAIVALFVLAKHKKHLADFIAMAIPPAIFLLAYNFLIFGSPFVNEYAARGDTAFTTSYLESIPGYLFSPSRSFLFITPPLVLTYYAIYFYSLKKEKTYAEIVLAFLSVALVGMLLLYGKWWCWYGADRFGYGFLTEWLPIAGLLTYAITLKLSNRIVWLILVPLMLYSIFIQANAVLYKRSRCKPDHNWSFYCLTLPTEKQDY